MKSFKHLSQDGIVQLNIQLTKRSKKNVTIPSQCWITTDAQKGSLLAKVYPSQKTPLHKKTKVVTKRAATRLKKIYPLVRFNIA